MRHIIYGLLQVEETRKLLHELSVSFMLFVFGQVGQLMVAETSDLGHCLWVFNNKLLVYYVSAVIRVHLA